MGSSHKLSDAIRRLVQGVMSSRLGLVGSGIATISAALIVASFLMESLGVQFGPYQGIITYLMLPTFFLIGLIMIPIGSYLFNRDGKSGAIEIKPFVIDLNNPKHRRFWGLVAALTLVNIVLLSTFSYKGYHYTESTKFCGMLCHSVMEPEYKAYKHSPHSRVDCVECHIGPGASWFVKSKLSGLRQVYGVIADDFSRPIPSPIENLRPARDTCEQCHWPSFFHGNRLKVFQKAATDDKPDDALVTALLLYVGGRSEKTGEYHGIHWHVSRDSIVEYRATDKKRYNIRDIRVTHSDGSREEYVKSDLPELPQDAEWRSMDCIDCHNRPSHIYETPEQAVDRLILTGKVDTALPDIRSASLEAIKGEFESQETARVGIYKYLKSYYGEKHQSVAETKAESIQKLAETLYEEGYARNVYPRLNIKWNTYASHLGHQNDLGCFRCHDEEHESKSGKTIEQDCESCHSILVEDERRSALKEDMRTLLFTDYE